MNKYETILDDVFSIFSATLWKSEEIKTVPSNYIASDFDNEFIRVTVLPSGGGINRQSVSGMLIIDIFTASGKGPKRLYQIADILDKFLVGKSVVQVSRTQFDTSTMSISGTDEDNPTLYRGSYSIPFNYFEAQI
jgi:hypothetical protein